MRIPLTWLREYAQVPAGATAEDVMTELVKVGFEEEDVHRPLDEISGPIVVGQVLTIEKEPQSNGKTINWCTVRVVPEGAAQTLDIDGIDPSGVQGIVCGAHNFVVGDKVVVTLPGAVLPGDFRITPRNTYGHISAGMIASVRELGIGDDHDGILVLSTLGLDPELGTDALALLGLDDEAAEINVTPDRGYAFSIRGVAREYAHATDSIFTDPASLVSVTASTGAGHAVGCCRPGPHLRQGRLRPLCGAHRDAASTPPRPPRRGCPRACAWPGSAPSRCPWTFPTTSCWNWDSRCTSTTPRRSPAALWCAAPPPVKRWKPLTARSASWTPRTCSSPIPRDRSALPASWAEPPPRFPPATTTVLIEAAHFEEVSIARSRRRHKLPSEASKRFERGVDVAVADVAAQRAVNLLVELAGGTEETTSTDVGTVVVPAPVFLPSGFTSARIGIDFTPGPDHRFADGFGCRCGEGRRRIFRHGPHLALRPGHQGRPDGGSCPPGGLRPDPVNPSHGTSRTRLLAHAAAAPPRGPGPGGFRPDGDPGVPVRVQGSPTTPSVLPRPVPPAQP